MDISSAISRVVVVLFPLIALAACGSGASPSPSAPSSSVPTPPPSPFPSPTSGPNILEGEVFDAQTGPIGNADINLWVQQERFGYSYWWANGRLTSNAAGHFVAANIPDSQITILAVRDGYVQPCAVTVDLRGNRALDVEMISTASLEASNPPRPRMILGRSLAGVIFETTPAGRQPIAGAGLWVENASEVGLASTRSDLRGGFFLCNLPMGAYLYVTKPGFNDTSQGPVVQSESMPLEIELKRR